MSECNKLSKLKTLNEELQNPNIHPDYRIKKQKKLIKEVEKILSGEGDIN